MKYGMETNQEWFGIVLFDQLLGAPIESRIFEVHHSSANIYNQTWSQ